MPETATARAGVLASLRPRVAVPRQARGTFVMALPCLVAVWMISGFYLSLGPSLAAQVLRSPDLLWGGLVIFLLTGTGASATVAVRRADGPAAMLAGCLALLAGAAVTLAAIQADVGPPSSPAPRWLARASARRCSASSAPSAPWPLPANGPG